MKTTTHPTVPYGAAITLVHSPDDGGWYAELTQHPLSGRGHWGGAQNEETTEVYATRADAYRAATEWIKENWSPVRTINLTSDPTCDD